MPTDIIVQLVDLMDDLDNNPINPYECLKEFLVTTFVPSKWAKARQLLKQPPLGDQKPSSLMAQMLYSLLVSRWACFFLHSSLTDYLKPSEKT